MSGELQIVDPCAVRVYKVTVKAAEGCKLVCIKQML